MPQMNSVLLSKADTAGDKLGLQPNKSSANDSKNNDFSTALAQASADNDPSHKTQGPSEADKIAHDTQQVVAADEQQDEDNDVANVLAQINWATQLAENQELADGGVPLPPDAELGSELKLSSETSTDELLASLTQSQLEVLESQTGLSQAQLAQLPPQMMAGLMEGAQQGNSTAFNALVEQANTFLAAQGAVNHGLGANSFGANSLGAKMGGDDAKSSLGGAQSGVSPELKPDAAGQITAKVQAQADANASAGNELKNAKLMVTMAAEGDIADNGVNELKPTSSTMTSTPFARAEAPAQYQVSIRPQGEPAQQMQEMIQKFSPVMRQQLIAMVSQGVQHAEIRLDPPELGQMMVRIQVQGDQTQVQFQVMQHQTKDLVEQAIPRLREMLAEQGMQLTDSNVSQGGGGREQGEADGSGHQNGTSASDVDEISTDESLLAANNATSYRSGIDYYA
ncbi:flagellar hook-length control protein FliK [Shewanella algidipiscicola]|uniref:flagellar hook-length control protein FliK n=1 Tax=Shewanella algidipiscicola TaxID=614070 RepID=UPI000D78954C|nr:flagellar hook-length control protein FliK [Shewanella algidipiscicola]